MPSGRRANSRAKFGLPHQQGQGAQIVAIQRQDVEGIELHFIVVLAGMERIEIGDAVDAEHDGFAVEDEPCG
jgi:hypothetical protein